MVPSVLVKMVRGLHSNMADEIKYPCLMKASNTCPVIVSMAAHGVGTVVGSGHTTGHEKYAIGYHCTTWQMHLFKPFKG